MNSLPSIVETKQLKTQLGEPYLKWQLASEIPAVVPLKDAQEVLILPASRLTPLPNMPDGVLGLFNRRGRVFWLVDLAQILQLTPLESTLQQYNITIVRIGPVSLGLAVEKIQGVIRLTAEAIQPPRDRVDLHLTPYLQGCVIQPKEVVLVLDSQAIVNSPNLPSNL
jgi:twitching motility protein PilI